MTVPLVMAFLAGAVAASALIFALVGVPLIRAAKICAHMEAGNLSLAVPEIGPGSLRKIAATVNGLAADFQEVLLLFAHLVRSAETSFQLFSRHAPSLNLPKGEAARLSEIELDIHEMKLMTRDFKYFRVSLDEDAIRDTGLSEVRSEPGATALPTGAENARPARVTAEGERA